MDELGFTVDASICVQRAAVEAAAEGVTVTVPVPERIDLRYPLTPRSMMEDGEKVISFLPPAETLSGERIHQWVGARWMVGRPGSDLIRLRRQQVFVLRLLQEGFDFRRAIADPELGPPSGPGSARATRGGRPRLAIPDCGRVRAGNDRRQGGAGAAAAQST